MKQPWALPAGGGVWAEERGGEGHGGWGVVSGSGAAGGEAGDTGLSPPVGLLHRRPGGFSFIPGALRGQQSEIKNLRGEPCSKRASSLRGELN